MPATRPPSAIAPVSCTTADNVVHAPVCALKACSVLLTGDTTSPTFPAADMTAPVSCTTADSVAQVPVNALKACSVLLTGDTTTPTFVPVRTVAPVSCTTADNVAQVPVTELNPCSVLLPGDTTMATCGTKWSGLVSDIGRLQKRLRHAQTPRSRWFREADDERLDAMRDRPPPSILPTDRPIDGSGLSRLACR